MARIVVVEDEPAIASAVVARLRSEGHDVQAIGDRQVAADEIPRLRPDLVILDLMLPGLGGLEVCRIIQQDGPVPVLMLTAKGDETDLVVGLAVGADDYLTKPFSMREAVAEHDRLPLGARLVHAQRDPVRLDERLVPLNAHLLVPPGVLVDAVETTRRASRSRAVR